MDHRFHGTPADQAEVRMKPMSHCACPECSAQLRNLEFEPIAWPGTAN